MQVIEHMRLAAEGVYTLGHLRKANDDALTGEALLQFGRMLENYVGLVTTLATTKGQVQ
jgi:hypothetical protein